jgi:hypothetical protein
MSNLWKVLDKRMKNEKIFHRPLKTFGKYIHIMSYNVNNIKKKTPINNRSNILNIAA